MAQYAQPTGGEPLKHETILRSADSTESADQLFNKATHWLATTYNSGKDVIDQQDKAAGIVVAKPVIRTSWKANFASTENVVINYTLQIETRFGRIRLTTSVYSFYTESIPAFVKLVTDAPKPKFSGSSKGLQQKEWDAVQKAIEQDYQASVVGLQKAINEKPAQW